jgi:glycosyltransferase involved in cell wall biosynthesis
MGDHMDEQLVSVIIPVYNSEAYLREAVESIIDQSYSNLEIIIIDDHSSDGSWDLINEYARKDERIVAIRNASNLNSAASRNVGIRRARGQYICLQDSDDVSEKDRVRKQVDVLRINERLGAVGSFVTVIDERSSAIGIRTYPTTNEKIVKTMTMYCPIGQPTMMIRRSVFDAVGLYNEKFSRAQDYELWFRVLQKYEISILEEHLVRYRRHGEQGLMNKTNENYNFTLELQKRYLFHPMFFSIRSIMIFPVKYCLKFLNPSTQIKILNLLIYNRNKTG